MLEKTPVCIDGRLRCAAETGVASYGYAVLDALKSVDCQPLTLMDGAGGRFREPSGRLATATRAVRAALPITVRLRRGRDSSMLFAQDVYRLAQVRFYQTGTLLPLRVAGPPGVMHWTYPIPARIEGWANVYTVHDVIPLTTPHLSSIVSSTLRDKILRIAESADRIVTVSDWARRSILAELGLAPHRVTDCGSGLADMQPGNGALPNGLRHGQYFLYCGLFEARKNLDRLATGWQISGATLPLVMAGPDRLEDQAIRAMLSDRGILVLPYQSRAALIDLMQGARALLFPTLEEGFGLPIIEAMALAVPVMTTDRGAMADTASGAALLVDAVSVDAIATGIRRLSVDDDLCSDLVHRGAARVKTFSPIAFGNRLTALYADIAP